MKTLIYSTLIGCLALTLSAQAAEENKPQAKKGRGAAHAQAAPRRASGPARPAMRRNASVGRSAQTRAFNPGRANANVGRAHANFARQNGAQRNAVSTASRRNEQRASVRNTVGNNRGAQAVRTNRNVAREQNAAAANAQRNNAAATGVANATQRQHRNVALVNRWNGSRFSGQQYTAFRDYRRQSHDRGWYRSHYRRFAIFNGGNYYFNNGYWYPAWGYDAGYNYGYDGPIYGYNNLDPQQVVADVQAQLQRQGYYNGQVDGSFGPITRQAIADFQADHGLPITSSIDQPTLATLGLS